MDTIDFIPNELTDHRAIAAELETALAAKEDAWLATRIRRYLQGQHEPSIARLVQFLIDDRGHAYDRSCDHIAGLRQRIWPEADSLQLANS